MEFWWKESALYSSFSWISKVALIVKNIIYAIHQEVVRNQKKECCDPKEKIELST
jgi:hypothetical protein